MPPNAQQPTPNSGADTLVTTGHGPDKLVASGGFLYWADPESGLSRASSSTGEKERLITTKYLGIGSLSAEGPNLYWTRLGASGGVFRLSPANKPEAVWTSDAQPSVLKVGGGLLHMPVGPLGLCVRRGTAYFTATNGAGCSLIALEAGKAKELATFPGAPWGITVDETDVYLHDQTFDAVWRVPCGGGAAERIAGTGSGTSLSHRQGIAQDQDHVYWADTGSIWRVPKRGGETQVLASATSPGFIWSITLAGDFLYFSERRGGTLSRVPKAGGRTELLASGDREPGEMTSDGEYIYWATGSTGWATGGAIRRWRIT